MSVSGPADKKPIYVKVIENFPSQIKFGELIKNLKNTYKDFPSVVGISLQKNNNLLFLTSFSRFPEINDFKIRFRENDVKVVLSNKRNKKEWKNLSSNMETNENNSNPNDIESNKNKIKKDNFRFFRFLQEFLKINLILL